MATRWARFFRGWVTAGLSVFIAALSHVSAGGSTPGLLGVVLAVTFAGVACVALAGRTLSWVRLAVSVAFSQIAFHFLFGLGAASPGSASSGSASSGSASSASAASSTMQGLAAHSHGGHGAATAILDPALLDGTAVTTVTDAAALATAALASAVPVASAPAHSAMLMWAAHVIAGLITLVLLRHGEAAFWTLLALARTALVAVLMPRFAATVASTGPGARTRTRFAIADRSGLRDLGVILAGRPHRGPPARLAAFL